MSRSHNYRNYVHLEGVVHDDPQGRDHGRECVFKIAVAEKSWDGKASVIRQQVFNVEVYDRYANYLRILKRGTPVSVDGSLALGTYLEGDVQSQGIRIKAHRVFALDLSDWKRVQEDRASDSSSTLIEG